MTATARTGGIRRVAVISLHTSPLDQPGTGDAGGMNVYVHNTARRLARSGIEVDVFTRAVDGSRELVTVEPGYRVRALAPTGVWGAPKESLPRHLPAFAEQALRWVDQDGRAGYDVIHSHYWLSGQVGWAMARRWDIPLVHSMHTLALVKNADVAVGDRPEPPARVAGERELVAVADRLVANTTDELTSLVSAYGAHPGRVDVVHPGVDLDVFSPTAGREGSGFALPAPSAGEFVILFVGRIQPLKGPDVAIRALAELARIRPDIYRRARLVVVGGLSGTGTQRPGWLQDLARSLGVADRIQWEPPAPATRLAQWYRSADVTVVPSHSESFGLVAVESQACGTPVVATDVGGLRTAVPDRIGGLLVPGHDPVDWARALAELADSPQMSQWLSRGAVRHARQFGWAGTVGGLRSVYRDAVQCRSAVAPLSVGA